MHATCAEEAREQRRGESAGMRAQACGGARCVRGSGSGSRKQQRACQNKATRKHCLVIGRLPMLPEEYHAVAVRV